MADPYGIRCLDCGVDEPYIFYGSLAKEALKQLWLLRRAIAEIAAADYSPLLFVIDFKGVRNDYGSSPAIEFIKEHHAHRAGILYYGNVIEKLYVPSLAEVIIGALQSEENNHV
jgi:hypothetical protein